jgi:nitrous oxidase accessory protein NosD
VHDNLFGYGIHVYDNSTNAAHRNIVRFNKSHHNARNGILIGSGADNIAHNNLVYLNGQRGIQVGFTGAVNNKVYNNTVWGNGTSGINAAGIEVRSPASGTIVQNNIFFNNGTEIINTGTGTLLTTNRTTDTLFISTATEAFELQAGSGASDVWTTIPGSPKNGANVE